MISMISMTSGHPVLFFPTSVLNHNSLSDARLATNYSNISVWRLNDDPMHLVKLTEIFAINKYFAIGFLVISFFFIFFFLYIHENKNYKDTP